MDNNYYTGATLMRGSHNNGHHHPHRSFHHSNHAHFPPSGPAGSGPNTSLAGPPLLMQPRPNKNLFSGVPLIRNGHQAVGNCGGAILPGSPGNPAQNQPPGVICCFQPVYYVPMPPGNPLHSSIPLERQLSLPPPPPPKKSASTTQPGTVKRRNYKSLQISTKPGQNLYPGAVTPQMPRGGTGFKSYQSPPAEEESPTQISSPLWNDCPPMPEMEERHSPLVDNIYCNDQEDKELNFQSAIESTRLVMTNEEKQRSDKLLNFYFYDEHWRPRESSGSNSSQNLESRNNNCFGQPTAVGQPTSPTTSTTSSMDMTWENQLIGSTRHNSKLDDPNFFNLSHSRSSSSFGQPNQGLSATASIIVNDPKWRLSRDKGGENGSPGPVGPGVIGMKKKDLEVEAQIVTLANGHRDLEIRLCYVTS